MEQTYIYYFRGGHDFCSCKLKISFLVTVWCSLLSSLVLRIRHDIETHYDVLPESILRSFLQQNPNTFVLCIREQAKTFVFALVSSPIWARNWPKQKQLRGIRRQTGLWHANKKPIVISAMWLYPRFPLNASSPPLATADIFPRFRLPRFPSVTRYFLRMPQASLLRSRFFGMCQKRLRRRLAWSFTKFSRVFHRTVLIGAVFATVVARSRSKQLRESL